MRISNCQIDITSFQDTLHKNPIAPLDTQIQKRSFNQVNDTTLYNVSTGLPLIPQRKNTNVLIHNDHNITVLASNDIPPLCTAVSSNSESLIATFKREIWLDQNQNKVCYFFQEKNEKIQASIFEKDKKDALNKKISNTVLEIREKSTSIQNWTFIPLLFGLFTLAFVVVLYRKQLGQIFEKVISFFVSTKHSKEKSIHFQRFSIILDLLFILSFSLLVDRAVQKLGYYSPPLKFEYLVFVIVSAFLVILRIFRWFVFKLSGLFSGLNLFFTDLYSNSTLHTRVLSVFLLPSVFLITYTTGLISTYIIYISLSITIIVLIIRIIRILRVFVDSGFSIFYFILYLCALEISPLLIIWRMVISR